MEIKVLLNKFLILGTAVITIYGCSSTNSSIRYNKEKEKTQKQSPVRFSSKEDEKPEVDTLNYDYAYQDEEEFDEAPPEEKNQSKDLLIKYYSENSSASNELTVKDQLIMEIIKYIDTPYKYGGTTKDGIDCSSFTQTIFRNIFQLEIPRTARDQYTVGEKIPENNLAFGDLVFFNTSRRVKPGHVGVYIGNNLFAHASRSLGVTVSSITSAYYAKRYMGARRLDSAQISGAGN